MATSDLKHCWLCRAWHNRVDESCLLWKASYAMDIAAAWFDRVFRFVERCYMVLIWLFLIGGTILVIYLFGGLTYYRITQGPLPPQSRPTSEDSAAEIDPEFLKDLLSEK